MAVVGALLQDALVPIGDLIYLAEDRQFIGVFNRFRWEAAGEQPPGVPGEGEDTRFSDVGHGWERVLCALRLDAVRGVKLRNLDRRDPGRVLELLNIEADADGVTLIFAGGGAIHLELESVQCALEDLVEPWPTQWRPDHPDAEAEESQERSS